MLADSLRRGLAAGLVAGLLAGMFALLVGEVPVREAIRLEEQAATSVGTTADATTRPATTDADGAAEVPISRPTQQAMLPVATALVGTCFGGLFGLAWAIARRHVRDPSDWHASWRMGAAAWLAVALVPSLTAPPNPPAVGDPATIGARSGWYLAAIVLSLVLAVGLWSLARWLRSSTTLSVPARQVLVALGAVVAVAGVTLGTPVPRDPITIPAGLLWDFRLASIGTQLVLWAGIAGVNGWLWHRAGQAPALVRTSVPA